MAEIQAVLPAKFMQVAGMHKAGQKDASTQSVQLASFFGVLKSQLIKQDVSAEALALPLNNERLNSESAKKPVPAQLDAEATLPAAVADMPVPLLQVNDATVQAAAVSAAMGVNMAEQKPEVSLPEEALPQEAESTAIPSPQVAATGVQSVAIVKPEGMPKTAGAAIAAVAGQALPQDTSAKQVDTPRAGFAPAVDKTGEDPVSTASSPLQSVRVDAGTSSTTSAASATTAIAASNAAIATPTAMVTATPTDPATAPITLVHPFDQALRQGETKINAAIEAPLRSPAFAAELSDKVVWLSTRQGQFADLSLNPPQMGTLEVRLTLSGGDASAQFFSPNPVVREVIDAALPKLRELMAQAGINLGEAEVRGQAFGRHEQPDMRNGKPVAQETDVAAHLAATAGIGGFKSAGTGLVDLYI